MQSFAGSYFDTPSTSRKVRVTITETGLSLNFDAGAPEHWPFDIIFAGQIAQGEAMCIGNTNDPAVRIFTSNDYIRAVQSAQKGAPFRIRRKIPWGPILLFGFLGLCVLVAFTVK